VRTGGKKRSKRREEERKRRNKGKEGKEKRKNIEKMNYLFFEIMINNLH
jgi:hypothetical protein